VEEQIRSHARKTEEALETKWKSVLASSEDQAEKVFTPYTRNQKPET